MGILGGDEAVGRKRRSYLGNIVVVDRPDEFGGLRDSLFPMLKVLAGLEMISFWGMC